MINGYLWFCDERDSLRLQLRSEIQRQTIDESPRGRSVWKAFRDMGEQSLCAADGTPRSAKEMWHDAYRLARKRDASIHKSIASMTAVWAEFFCNHIAQPRKIDALLGQPGDF